MRIALASLTGALLAGLLSYGVVQASTKTPDPVVKPLYNYGTR